MTVINLKKYIEEIASIKNQISIQSEVSEELSQFGIFEEVTELPTGDNINPHKIYFIPNDDGAENDEYDIYAYIDDDWEKIDSSANVSVDTEGFITTDELNYALSTKADIGHGHDSTDIVDIPDMNDVILKSETSGLVKNDGTIDTNDYLTSEDIAYIGESGGGTPLDLSNYIQKSQTSGLVKNDGTIDSKHYVEEENGKGLFTGSYIDLIDKPSFTQDANITSNTSGRYPIGTVNINGSDVVVYGKDTDTTYSGDETTISKSNNTFSLKNSSEYVKKSSTPGFIKNDGSIEEANNYVHPNTQQCVHNHDNDYASKSHSHQGYVGEPDQLNTGNTNASVSYVNFMRVGNVVSITGMVSLKTLANTSYEYSIFTNSDDNFKPSSNITWAKVPNVTNASDIVIFTLKTDGTGYVTPIKKDTSGYIFLNCKFTV